MCLLLYCSLCFGVGVYYNRLFDMMLVVVVVYSYANSRKYLFAVPLFQGLSAFLV